MFKKCFIEVDQEVEAVKERGKKLQIIQSNFSKSKFCSIYFLARIKEVFIAESDVEGKAR